ncbi:MAG: hypothetical protein ABI847_05185 [Anaerolineales bacterium]
MPKEIVTRVVFSIIAALAAFGLARAAPASASVNPANQWVWSTNAGWINLNPANGGVTVCADHLEGYAWGENIGWIRMGTFSGCAAHTYGNATTFDYGVNRNASGQLSGYAWSTNAGWIKFNPTFGGVTVKPSSGPFRGFAWAENFGWIRFQGPALLLPLLQR